MSKRNFSIWRGDKEGGSFQQYEVELDQGMVVLDAIHRIQATQANDLAVRWNCKAGKCGSCSMEINGKPSLSCMTRMNSFEPNETITIQPLKTFPILKDLVCDVSWNYTQNQRVPRFRPKPRDADGQHRMYQQDIDRIQEHRKCIECFLCQDVCHILRDREQGPMGKDRQQFVGPRFMLRLASLEMHPLDDTDRVPMIRSEFGSGMCNITRCCTDVCPEHINITDNAIIPLKERVVDRYYDPLLLLKRKLFGDKNKKKPPAPTNEVVSSQANSAASAETTGGARQNEPISERGTAPPGPGTSGGQTMTAEQTPPKQPETAKPSAKTGEKRP